MDNKQTAVEWLQHQIYLRGPVGDSPNDTPQWLKDLYDQAKAMEKAQIQSIIDETLSAYRLYLNDSNRIK